jgi:hypothetical protein
MSTRDDKGKGDRFHVHPLAVGEPQVHVSARWILTILTDNVTVISVWVLRQETGELAKRPGRLKG